MIPLKKNKLPDGSGERGATVPCHTATSMNQETAVAPRFLVIKRLDGSDFSKVSPFLIHKAVYGIAGETKLLKKTRDGLLIETASCAQSKRLLNLEQLAEYPVEVIPHASLNSSKGVIYCRDFLNCSVTEIEENLKNKGVLSVKRIQTKKNGIIEDTPNLILTFDNPKLPKYINAAMYRLEVRPFIPNPLRCFKCQLFGHTSIKCTKEETCVCGKPKHENSPCQTPICVHCGGNHFAQDRNCPKYKEELAIQKVKVMENLSYTEARKRVVINTPTPGVTYSQTVQASLKDNLKDIIQQIVPEIVKICTSIIQDQKSSPSPSIVKKTVTESFSRPAPKFSQTSVRSISQTSQDKRPIEESDDSDRQSSSSQMQAPIKRRPGRPPKKNKYQEIDMESETEIKSSSQTDIFEIT